MRRRGRGRHAAPLGAADRLLLAEMLADATDARLAASAQPCSGCDQSATLLCARHVAEVRQVEAYRALAARLGVGT